MSDSPPQLSVVIPVHDAAGFASIFVSQFEDCGHDPTQVEFIVVDDGSSDEGALRFEQALSPLGHVARLSITSTLGPGSARNLGLRFASAPYVAFWDADDSPNLAVFLDLISGMHQVGASIGCVGYSVVRTPEREVVDESLPGPMDDPVDLLATRAAVWRFVFAREFLERAHIQFPSTSLGEDLQFLLEAFEKHQGSIEATQSLGYTYTWAGGQSLSGGASPTAYTRLLLRLLPITRSFEDPAVRATSANWALRIWMRCDLQGKARASLQLLRLLSAVARSGQLNRTLTQLRRARRTRLK